MLHQDCFNQARNTQEFAHLILEKLKQNRELNFSLKTRIVSEGEWKQIVGKKFPKKTYGMCHYNFLQGFSVICIQEDLLDTVVDPSHVEQIILHEIAHSLTPGARHGSLFRKMAVYLGVYGPFIYSRSKNCPVKFKDASKNKRHIKEYSQVELIQAGYKWVCVLVDTGQVVCGYFRKPNPKTISGIRNKYLRGRPETKGFLNIIPAEQLEAFRR